jgi:hypothetical protein
MAWTWNFLRGRSRWYLLPLLCLIIALSVVTTSVFVPFCVVPMFLFCVGYGIHFRHDMNRKFRSIVAVCCVTVSALLGMYVLFRYFVPKEIGAIRPVFTVDFIASRSSYMLKTIFYIPKHMDGYVFFLLSFFIFVPILLVLRLGKKTSCLTSKEFMVMSIRIDGQTYKYLFFVFIALVLFPISIIAPLPGRTIYDNGAISLVNLRYFHILGIWLGVGLCFTLTDCFNRKTGLMAIVSCISMSMACFSWYAFSQRPRLSPPVVSEFVNQLLSDGVPLEDGIAGYHGAMLVSAFSKDKNMLVFCVDQKLLPRGNLQYNRAHRVSGRIFNFIINDFENKRYTMSVVPPPGYIRYTNGKYPKKEIYYYPNKNLDEFFVKNYDKYIEDIRKKNKIKVRNEPLTDLEDHS